MTDIPRLAESFSGVSAPQRCVMLRFSSLAVGDQQCCFWPVLHCWVQFHLLLTLWLCRLAPFFLQRLLFSALLVNGAWSRHGGLTSLFVHEAMDGCPFDFEPTLAASATDVILSAAGCPTAATTAATPAGVGLSTASGLAREAIGQSSAAPKASAGMASSFPHD